MRGHITKRGKNSYSIVLNLGQDPVTGKYRQQWVSIKGNKKDAEMKLSELLNQLDSGTFVKPSKVTVAEYLQEWLTSYAELNCSPKTIESYRQLINSHLIAELGNIKLVELEAWHLQAMYSKKRIADYLPELYAISIILCPRS